MEINEVKQNTQEWLNWRYEGIGASDAPAITGVSRFKTREQLLKEKILRMSESTPKSEFITNRGHEVEDAVRVFLSNLLQEKFTPQSYCHGDFSFLRASVDGAISSGKVITEIKLLSRGSLWKKTNPEAAGYIKFMEAKSGKVPTEYYDQIQHQLFVTGAEKCVFVGFRDITGVQQIQADQVATVDVYTDKAYMKSLLVKECQFWYDVLEGRKAIKNLGGLE